MAERRMMTKKVTDDEGFLNLSSSAQALYLHLSMSADDDGFSNQITLSMFKAHATPTDLQALLKNRYIYQFESGVIVIKHWRMANALRKDRYNETIFKEEMEKLMINANGEYDWLPSGCQVGASLAPQVRLGKDRLGKDNISISKKQQNALAVDLKYIKLTQEQLDKLNKDFPDEDVINYIDLVEEYIESTGNKNKYKDFYLVCRKAIRDKWFKKEQKDTKKVKQTPGWYSEFKERGNNSTSAEDVQTFSLDEILTNEQ